MSTVAGAPGAWTLAELSSQPECWERASRLDAAAMAAMPADGEPVLVLGCGTSFHVGDSWARLREAAGKGRTRAAVPTELERVDDDETVVLLSRSGTTADLLTAAERLRGRHRVVALVGATDSPLPALAHAVLPLDWADEQSVVQTRFATTAHTVLRHALGIDLSHLPTAGRDALVDPLPVGPDDLERLEHVVFLGTRWSSPLAHEAALKVRESAGSWTEAYPVLEYQHGPISCAGPRSLVWSLADVPGSVAADVVATGARLEVARRDPVAELVRVHRLAVALAQREGRDPDRPPHLSRSVRVTQA